MENGMQMTFGEYMPEIFQERMSGALDSHARISPLSEDKMDFKETAQASFSELCTFLDRPSRKKDPTSYSLRMLKICLVLMEDGISPDFSLKWIGGGTMQNGSFSTLSISSHKTENEYSLLDILETEKVPDKYYLSNKGGAYVTNLMRIQKEHTRLHFVSTQKDKTTGQGVSL